MQDIFREIDRVYPPGGKTMKPGAVAKATRDRAFDAILTAALVMADPRSTVKQVADAKRREINLTEDDPQMREMMVEAVDDYERLETAGRRKKKPASRSGRKRKA